MSKAATIQGEKRGKTILTVVFTIIAIVYLLPIFLVLMNSFKANAYVNTETFALPNAESFVGVQNYIKGMTFGNYPFAKSVGYSLFITVVGTVINILLTMLAAYALTRPNLVGKRILMVFFIIMMLFDPGIVPEYIVVRELKLMGSQWSVILSQAMNVYYLIVMMRYFESVPHSLYEAALLDGAGHFRILFKIVGPLSKAGIATLTMFYGVARWNEYYRSGIYISSIKKVPLQVILRKFVVDGDVTTLIGTQNLMDYNALAQIDYTALQYATIIVSIIPILLVYPLVLKFYTKNITAGGVKE